MLQSQIRQLYSVIDGRRWQELGQVFDSAAVYERPGYPRLDGLERIRTFYERERIIADGVHHLSTALLVGDSGASSGVFIGTLRDGSAVEQEFAEVFRFHNRLIVYRKTFFYRPAI